MPWCCLGSLDSLHRGCFCDSVEHSSLAVCPSISTQEKGSGTKLSALASDLPGLETNRLCFPVDKLVCSWWGELLRECLDSERLAESSQTLSGGQARSLKCLITSLDMLFYSFCTI